MVFLYLICIQFILILFLNLAARERLPVVKDEELQFDKTIKVTKTGRSTGTTTGHLIGKNFTFAERKFGSPCRFFSFYKCYLIGNVSEDQDFIKPGDSGSGVYVIQNEETNTYLPLGIAFGLMAYGSKAIVCKIDNVVEKLNLTIVRYKGRTQKQTSNQRGNTYEENKREPMDIP